MKRKHKFLFGGASTLIIIFLIINSILIYGLFSKVELQKKQLNEQITKLQTDTQSKLNELTENILDTQNDLTSLGMQVGSIDEEISTIKADTSADFSGIIEDAIKSVVTIRTDISQGTGFVINSDGYIVTNYHVMESAKAAAVLTYEGDSHQVTLIGVDKTMDVALLKIKENYPALEIGNSDKISIGEKVIAIGNPLGLQFSVTEGIISALNRPGINNVEAYIQTDAALNPGNSGGPLINKQGKAIGINNFKVGGGESLGFALESNFLKDSINQIAIAHGLNETLV